MEEITIRQIKYGTEQYKESFELRNSVLGIPFGLNLYELDMSCDKEGVLICAFNGSKIVGTIVLLSVDKDTAKMRQVAVTPILQGQKIGARMAQYAEEIAREQGYKRIEAAARKTAAGFYDKLGYKREGEEFTQVGLTHIKVVKAVDGLAGTYGS